MDSVRKESPIPMKSGLGPVDWFQTHNVAYNKLNFRQWMWILWHYLTAFGVMFAYLSWSQEVWGFKNLNSDDTTSWNPAKIKGWKGVIAAMTGLVLYWLLPHRMYYFFGDAPYSQYQRDHVAGNSDHPANSRWTSTCVSNVEGHFSLAVPYPELRRPGVLPDWFEIENVPYTYLYWRQWAWIIWHYITAFGVMFAILSWFQESQVLEGAATFREWKGVMATCTGLLLYWVLPHRMYNFHDPEPNTS